MLGVAAEADGVCVQVHSVHVLRQVVQVKEPARRACHDIFFKHRVSTWQTSLLNKGGKPVSSRLQRFFKLLK